MRARALAACALALAAVGCGAPSASLVSLRAQAARVCTRAQVKGGRIAPPALPAQTGAFLRRGIAVLRPELAGLRRLRAPSEQSGTYSAAVNSLARELTILADTNRALDRGADPLSTIKTLQQKLTPVEVANADAWKTLGVPACVNR